MKMKLSIGRGGVFLPWLFIMNLLLAGLAPQASADGTLFVPGIRSYCNVPPLPGAGVKANLLLMIDNSASMYDPAYTDSSRYCIDDGVATYEQGSQYPGYFESGSLYGYAFKKDGLGNESGYFELSSAQSIPLSDFCNEARTEYLCVNGNAGKITQFLARGTFLNWLSMSKLDLAKKVLTGGKLDPATGLLQAETRGCRGTRFVKTLGASKVSFAVRGPSPSESDYRVEGSRGGMTRIEVYLADDNSQACREAMAARRELVEIMSDSYSSPPGPVPEAIGELSGTLIARFTPPAAPKGVIQEFSDAINFGAMVFNDNGAGSECGEPAGGIPCLKHCQSDPVPQNECERSADCKIATPGSCAEDPRKDGGRIISYLNQSPLDADHPDSGLIASINRVAANSWTPLAETFYEALGYFAGRSDLRLQPDDFDTSRPPSKFSCQGNNILIVTDGMSTADRAKAVNDFVAAGVNRWVNDRDRMPAGRTTTSFDPVSADPPYQGSYNLDDLAWIARNKNGADSGKPIAASRDYLSTHVLYAGAPCGDPRTGAGYDADGTCRTSDEGVPEKMMQLVASKGGGRIVSVRNTVALESALREMSQQIGAGSDSATRTSILSSGDGNGALFLQEQFYPFKSFDGGVTSTSWIGEMQALWYYIDPFIGSTGGASTIREDSGGGHTLDLKRDRVVQFGFDADLGKTWAKLYLDADGDGTPDPLQPAGYPEAVSPDAVRNLWRAGLQLWKRDPATRTIYTQTDGKNLLSFASQGRASFFLDSSQKSNQLLLQASSETEAQDIISFVRGTDSVPFTRDRGVCLAGGNTKRVWPLGDIISSTPALQSAASLGGYGLPTPLGYDDGSYRSFIASDAYKGRGTVYVGANDGMLHAFRLGGLQLHPAAGWPPGQKAALSGTGLGEEEWAFIPRNALPYLRYLKEPGYPHLYYVDGSSTLVDASLGDPAGCARESYWSCPKDLNAGANWRTVLIGGMGLGGATREPGCGCLEGSAGTCVKSPVISAGRSSYFALDVTGQTGDGRAPPPTLLWEFSPEGLGFATSGAAIVKINARTGTNSANHDPDKNGRWFAVFASGPTGSIDAGSCQFLGKSDQHLRLFVVDLYAVPPLTEGGNYWVIDTGIPFAFAGDLTGAGIDTDRWNVSAPGYYEDDALYVGYTRKDPDGTWTGGVLRLLTRENPDPALWVTSTVIDGVGPVTGSVSKLQDRRNKNLWLYFGTGRYFFNQDDMTAGRALFGVKEPCYTERNTLVDGNNCTAAIAPADLSDATDPAAPGTPGSRGWRIRLDAATDRSGSERLVANPTALTGGTVFFPTFKPSSDLCQQGTSYLWGVKYDSGGSAAGSLNGKALVPLSNAGSAEFSLSGWTDKGGRRSREMTGKPAGVKLVTNSGLKPLKKIIHLQER